MDTIPFGPLFSENILYVKRKQECTDNHKPSISVVTML